MADHILCLSELSLKLLIPVTTLAHRSPNGAMIGAVAKRGVSWFMKLKNNLMSVREGMLGMLKSLIAVSLSSVGLYLC